LINTSTKTATPIAQLVNVLQAMILTDKEKKRGGVQKRFVRKLD
jgi:hypothetical protein